MCGDSECILRARIHMDSGVDSGAFRMEDCEFMRMVSLRFARSQDCRPMRMDTARPYSGKWWTQHVPSPELGLRNHAHGYCRTDDCENMRMVSSYLGVQQDQTILKALPGQEQRIKPWPETTAWFEKKQSCLAAGLDIAFIPSNLIWEFPCSSNVFPNPFRSQ